MTAELHQILLEQHRTFLCNEYNQGTLENITNWVDRELIHRSAITSQSKFAFFEAQKNLLIEFIKANNFDGIVILMQAIDSAEFGARHGPYNINLTKFRTNQCVVLSKAIIEAEDHLNSETRLHRSLGRMLYNRFRKQQESESSMWRSLLLDKVPRALSIVQFRTPGRLFESPEAPAGSSARFQRRRRDSTGPSHKLKRSWSPSDLVNQRSYQTDLVAVRQVEIPTGATKLQAQAIGELSLGANSELASSSGGATREPDDASPEEAGVKVVLIEAIPAGASEVEGVHPDSPGSSKQAEGAESGDVGIEESSEQDEERGAEQSD